MNNIIKYMSENLLILDGAMGTQLQDMGLGSGELPESWNTLYPDRITEIHKRYYKAGANLVLTNTFGANRLKLGDGVERTVVSAVENAKRARECFPGEDRWVALDVGPLGKMLAPLGTLELEEAVSLFGEVIEIGAKAGADCVFIETMGDTMELKAAVLAAKERSTLPVFASVAYGNDGKLLTGADPGAVIALLEGLGVDALGINCSLGPKQIKKIVNDYLLLSSTPILVKPNAGLPSVVDGKTVYDCSPEEFSEELLDMVKAGVRGVGGCCGTTPKHIEKVASLLMGLTPKPITDKGLSLVSSYTHSVDFGKRPVLIGERINPTGKPRFKEALRQGDMNYILKEGIMQTERGASVLDVNVGLPDIDEVEMLKKAVVGLQSVTDTPLQIDTSNPCAMEAALRLYNGKPMLNSVNGKSESLDTVLPIAKKYGALVVALTLDESGIPTSADERLEIARRILNRARDYGINKKDIIFDPLTLAVSSDPTCAAETLRAVKLISEELGCKTSLGVSNVSFGLPMRDILNGSFFTMALSSGLSAAIMNPYSDEMMKAYHGYLALMGLDMGCGEYIAFADGYTDASPIRQTDSKSTHSTFLDGKSELECAIIRGMRDLAREQTLIALEGNEPLSVVEKEIIPALDFVGRGYEKGSIYLPSLLMSAEAAGAAFEVIKERIKSGAASKCRVILATVKGDIHDIGKNIVKLLLENYGFAVTDLGRDVSSEVICNKAAELGAVIVGLSALMTTTVPAMEETVRLLKERTPGVKIMVGGAVLTEEYAQKIGADFYGKDAMEAVRYAENVNNSL